ncbi:ABC transporter permease [Conexibacter woesei]|uniref:Binding-protein-dependent transport systems inner membrane component n=1 Tax=Conexibacter woesei (strain DSM 14684 / CCUG 47730 / CIP 108061 / JCM 11494 / NBRC 100937 / ID131577) TaxID=469383 RepID=D3F6C3_CONWI|nr:ABC transporter permease [Conexibacter woesei]ADB50690.1 binding-protein-dependent transport systems inner membrane component [Conexibacter woesei DSM 14684]
MTPTGRVAAPRRRGAARRAGDPTGIRAGLLLLVPLAAGVLFLVLPLILLADRALAGHGVSGFADVLTDATFLDAGRRTLLLSVVVTGLCVVVGTVYAVALVAAPRRLSLVLLGVLLSAFWISLLVRTFGWVVLFQPNGALDQLLQKLGLTDGSLELLQTTRAMYPAMLHVLLPFFVLPVFAACMRLDPDLLRASQSLGARPLAVLWHVVLPHLRSAIVASASLVFMLALAFYVTPLMIGGPSQLTISTLIDREFGQEFDLAGAAAMGLVLLAFVLVIYVIVDRFVSLVPGRE